MKERRVNPRIPLENILYFNTISDGRTLRSVLLDISVVGARVGLPPGDALPPTGSEVMFKDCSVLGPLLDNRTATVMWGGGVQFGVQFTQALDVSLESIAVLLQSEIFY